MKCLLLMIFCLFPLSQKVLSQRKIIDFRTLNNFCVNRSFTTTYKD